MEKINQIVKQYIDDVLNNKDLHCRFEQLAVKRYLGDLENAKQKKIYFDEEDAQHALDFFNFTTHSKGEWAGQPFAPEPWEVFITWNLYGWKRENGTRRFRIAYIEVPRKNGKSTYCAVNGNYLFRADGEPGAEIYTAATKRDQAIIVHQEAVNMMRKSKYLNRGVKIVKNNMSMIETASKFEPLGADADTMDGLNIHGCIIDELHAHKTRAVWDVLDTATGSRRQPLVFVITTAGFDRHSVCWEQHEYTEKILNGIIEDDSYFGIIFTIDEKDSWEDEKAWRKANPNYGKSVKIDDFKRLYIQAKEMPSKQNAFKRLKLNIWTESETRWFSDENWKKGNGKIFEHELIGRMFFGALDLSSNSDLTAWGLLFPPLFEKERFKLLIRFFLPKDNMKKRVEKDKVPYDVWAKQGYIILTPGDLIDYDFILSQVDKDVRKYDIKEIAYDRWGATKIVQELQKKDLTVIPFGQGFASMGPACKDFERTLMSGKLNHGNNPVLNWMASNVVIVEDAAGLIKPDKSKSTEKIDGVVAAIMALDRALRNPQVQSAYESEGLLII